MKTHAHTHTHQLAPDESERNDCSLSYQIIQDGDREIKHAHLHRLSQGFMQAEQRFGLHLTRWRESRLLSRRLLHIMGMLLPLVCSLIDTQLPPSLSLSLPFKSECTGALYFVNKNCSPLSVYFSSLVTRSTNRNLLQLSLKLSCHLLLLHQETVRNLNDSTSSQRFLLHIVSLSNNLQTM